MCTGADGAGMVSAARGLLAAVTRVLLLADMVVVRQLLLAKDKVSDRHCSLALVQAVHRRGWGQHGCGCAHAAAVATGFERSKQLTLFIVKVWQPTDGKC